MPFFLLGHLAYCRSFARGCDVSKRRFLQFEILKKLAIIGAILYAFLIFFLLEPSFDGPLKVVLVSYIAAIALMFIISLFGRSRLLILGSGLYLISDSIIAVAEFVLRGNVFAEVLDYYGAFPIYFVGQMCLTFGALNSFSDLQLHPNPKMLNSEKNLNTMINLTGLFTLLFIIFKKIYGK